MSTAERHPVWEVFNLKRSCRLSLKYHTVKLARWKRVYGLIEGGLAAASAGSVFSGLAVWKTTGGEAVWGFFTFIIALVVIAKPIVKPVAKIELLQQIIAAYRGALYQLEELEHEILHQKSYSQSHAKMFMHIRKQIEEGARNEPMVPDDEKLRRKCYELVNAELPADNFYEPPL